MVLDEDELACVGLEGEALGVALHHQMSKT
jgi:hypothetical protein